ncbi:MAG: phosphopantetheine-binding protein [Sandaracinaceae bacterium]|nr:MAG: acyl carrier protein [Sandaracinaceae bacterium]HBQ13417.1 acyl carrier protein [Myxococcales bacterium]
MSEPLRQFLKDELPGVEDVTDEEDLLAPGMLDSLAIIRLVANLEDAEGITVAQDEIVPANFRTLAAIRAFVQRKKDA